MIQEYIDTAFPTGKPQWTTENEIVLQTEAFKLRRFSSGEGENTLIVPPQAGHSSHIADYDTGQSIVETIVKERGGSVYVIEWLSCTQDRRHESIEDLLRQLHECYSFIQGGHLIGLCQGGWLAAIYAAMEETLSLTCIASPIDFHKGGGIIYDKLMDQGLKPYRKAIVMFNGIMPGYMMLFCWKLMHPMERYFGDYCNIWWDAAEGNTEKLRKTKRFRTWYESTQDIAGTWYLEAVEELFYYNKLVRDELILFEETIKLSNITCPVAMIAGEKDDITLESHLFALEEHVSSDTVHRVVIPKCGHVGCFMGRKSQSYISEIMRRLDD